MTAKRLKDLWGEAEQTTLSRLSHFNSQPIALQQSANSTLWVMSLWIAGLEVACVLHGRTQGSKFDN